MKKWVLFLMVLMGAGRVDARPYMPEVALDASCPKEKPFGYHSDCVGCDYLEMMVIERGHEVDFEICSNRETINTKSILKSCPKNAPVRDVNGSCWPCSYKRLILATKEECDKCANRIAVEDQYLGEICELRECPPETPMRVRHECLPCNLEVWDPIISREDCGKCPNHEYVDGKCILKKE